MFNDKYMFDNEWFYPSSIQFISLQIIKKKIQTTKFNNLREKKSQVKLTHNPLMLNIKIMNPFYHFHWFSNIFTNIPNYITHSIVTKFKRTKEKKFRPLNSTILLALTFFCTSTHKPI